MKEVKEEENKVTRKRQQVVHNKKTIRFNKPDFKLPEILKLTKKQITTLMGILFILAAVMCFSNYDKIGLVFNKKITDEDTIKVDLITSNNKLYVYQDEVLVANSDGIATYNKYGKQTWELDLNGAIDDYINTSGKYLQVINHDKSLIYIYKNKYEVARVKVEGKILSGTINEKGYSVIEYTTTGSKTTLAVFDNKGNLEYNVRLNNNIIGEYVLSNNLKYLAYADVNIKGISVSTSVVLVELETNNIIKLDTSEKSLVYDLKFDGNSLIYKFDEEIVCYNINNKGKSVSTIANDSIVNIDICSKKYAYAEFKNGKYFFRSEKYWWQRKKEYRDTRNA